MLMNTSKVLVLLLASLMATVSGAQTREKGPWWPSKYGPADQAGATNTVTP